MPPCFAPLGGETTNFFLESHSTQEEEAPGRADGATQEGADSAFFRAAIRASRTNVTALTHHNDARAASLAPTLAELRGLGGFVALALIDAGRGLSLAVERTSYAFDVAAAAEANAVLMRAGAFGVMGTVEGRGRDARRSVPLDAPPTRSGSELFFYLVVRRGHMNIALAQMALERLSQQAAA